MVRELQCSTTAATSQHCYADVLKDLVVFATCRFCLVQAAVGHSTDVEWQRSLRAQQRRIILHGRRNGNGKSIPRHVIGDAHFTAALLRRRPSGLSKQPHSIVHARSRLFIHSQQHVRNAAAVARNGLHDSLIRFFVVNLESPAD
jgi:hypothetical protein